MTKFLAALVFVSLPALGASPNFVDKTPTAEKIAENKSKTDFMVVEKVNEKSFKIEQNCPSPEIRDVMRGTEWNSLELGIGLPLGTPQGDIKLYSRYTCQFPKEP